MRLSAEPEVRFYEGGRDEEDGPSATICCTTDDQDSDEEDMVWEVAQRVHAARAWVASLKSAIETRDPMESRLVEQYKEELLREYGDSSVSGVCPQNPR